MNKLRTGQTLKKFQSLKMVILRKIANHTVNYFQGEVFDSQGGVIGGRWKQSGRSKKDGGKTLQKTGRGKRNISERIISNEKAIISPKVKYMEYHQTGAGNNPKRPFMGNSKKLLNDNNRIIARELGKI
jgi:phage gpG-like protein